MRTLRRVSFLCALIAGSAAPFTVNADTAIAMHGAPKYAVGFDHFDYVNPDAPKGGTLRLGVAGSFDSLNPFVIRGQTPLGVNTGTLSLIYEPLMARSWDEPFTLYGLIAESVDVPEDRSSITFHLNPKAHWSDGQPITADDVLFSFTTLRDKGRPNHRSYYKRVNSAEKIDAMAVRFVFRPNSDGSLDQEMPLIMGLMPILPQHDWVGRDFNQTTLRVPVGSGPYKIAKMETGRSITYDRDTNYWGRDLPVMRGVYNFDTIKIDYYRDDGIALQAFKAGQFDWRREIDATKWATGYDVPALKEGRIVHEQLTHHRTEPIAGFIFNTRRAPFDNSVLREALSMAFDSEWINRNLFHGQYHRSESFFPNSELASPFLPEGREKEILASYGDKISPSIFMQSVRLTATDGTEDSLRQNLLKASMLLHDAGYVLKDGKLYAPLTDHPVRFEILLSDPTEEKIALAWSRVLKQLGVDARVHTVDSAQYQSRLAGFDYDITTGKWVNSLSPGNEQANYWGSMSADQKGSRNYAGIRDVVIDDLITKIPSAKNRDELVATTRALDRLLLAGHYVVPFYYRGVDLIASWKDFHHPDTMPIYGTVLESWWRQ
jgi:microcin C transport system substrate-binding protein